MMMINNIELRWKLRKANKGHTSIPKSLQYRVQNVIVITDNTYGFTGHSREELVWSDWKHIPTSK
jgi:hypothetical protein